MKTQLFLAATLFALSATAAQASATFQVTLTNGSSMPLSPAALYVRDGGAADQQPGVAPTRGFIQLCQTGNPMERVNELRMNRSVHAVAQTMGLLMPGESRTVEIEVADPSKQSIHFETMYGKTKDVCAVGSAGSHALYALKSHVSDEYVGRDDALLTGAFLDPVLPAAHANYTCAQAASAIDCVRELSAASSFMAKIRFFSGYLPSVVSFLEQKYGAADTLSLLFPAGGAVRFTVKLKH